MQADESDIVVVLHDIRSTHNVGSLFRTADGAGVSHVYLSGYTPAPIDRFGRIVKDIAKTALGAELSVKWSTHKTFSRLAKKLSQDGYMLVALENGVPAEDYRKVKYPQKVALIVGNEVTGLPKLQLKYAKLVVEIPMYGVKESLNVGVAFGVALFRIREALTH